MFNWASIILYLVNCLSTDCQSFISIVEHLNYSVASNGLANADWCEYNMFDLREVRSFSIVGLDVSDPVI